MDLRYQIILAALLLVNIVAFAAYGIDKRKAQKGQVENTREHAAASGILRRSHWCAAGDARVQPQNKTLEVQDTSADVPRPATRVGRMAYLPQQCPLNPLVRERHLLRGI